MTFPIRIDRAPNGLDGVLVIGSPARTHPPRGRRLQEPTVVPDDLGHGIPGESGKSIGGVDDRRVALLEIADDDGA